MCRRSSARSIPPLCTTGNLFRRPTDLNRHSAFRKTLVDPPIEGETNPNPKANFQKISACQRLGAQQFFSEIRFTEIKAHMMDDPNISRRVKHRIQVASQRGSGTASLVVPSGLPTENCLEMDDDATT